jgi:transaldolase
VPKELHNRLGIAVATLAYEAYRNLLASPRWKMLAAAGARPQRLLWASTSTKDPDASDILYLKSLAAPDTVNTIPEKTLLAFADHGSVDGVLPVDGGDAKELLAEFAKVGIDEAALASQLQSDGARSFTTSWNGLMETVASRSGVPGTSTRSGGKP